ncbi:uncharacterized protein LOC129587818 isoform X2 [Paramacrobiotus metropolitanus]|uniref:uncharacterized protein LOC129587818 isoform X2 n=1 Tax=Paramacrobiotus metropolitanus TaxID=2943436 RepID=UPI002445871A|nr:uncharacterized protein LOC129587818 isoform X2 [Paramacrobiotus metropolitanus]
MENFVTFPIHKFIYTDDWSLWTVDVLAEADNVVLRGRVCGVHESGLLVKTGSCENSLLVPFSRLRRTLCCEALSGSDPVWPDGSVPDYDDRDLSSANDIEVLISLEENQPESWQPARILKGVLCCHWLYGNMEYGSLVKVELLSGKSCYLIDGPDDTTRRVRSHAVTHFPEYTYLTAEEYSEVQLNFKPCADYPDPMFLIKTAIKIPEFPYFWRRTTGTVFVSCDINTITVIKWRYHTTTNDPEFAYYVLSDTAAFITKVDQMVKATTYEQLISLVSTAATVGEAKNCEDGSAQSLFDLPWDIQVMIFSYLDAYAQSYLKRVCTNFFDLSCWHRCRSVILPTRYSGIREIIDSLDLYAKHRREDPENAFLFSHLIAHCVTSDTKVIYLSGNWKKCLSCLVDLLRIMEVRLDWLVVTDNSELLYGEFLKFPNPHIHLEVKKIDDNGHTGMTIYCLPVPEYRSVCANILLKNSSFNSDRSIKYRTLFLTSDVEGDTVEADPCTCIWNCSGYELDSDRNPFTILVSRWHYSFANSAPDDFEKSMLFMFQSFCPELDKPSVTRLVSWLDCLSPSCLKTQHTVWPLLKLSLYLFSSRWLCIIWIYLIDGVCRRSAAFLPVGPAQQSPSCKIVPEILGCV